VPLGQRHALDVLVRRPAPGATRPTPVRGATGQAALRERARQTGHELVGEAFVPGLGDDLQRAADVVEGHERRHPEESCGRAMSSARRSGSVTVGSKRRTAS
jgi:hypothetical protein